MSIKPPSGLPRAAASWFRRMCEEFDFQDDPAGLELLTASSWQLARMQTAREEIKTHGLLVKDRFGQLKTNPAVDAERAAANQFRLLCRELGVGDGTDEAARITRSKRG